MAKMDFLDPLEAEKFKNKAETVLMDTLYLWKCTTRLEFGTYTIYKIGARWQLSWLHLSTHHLSKWKMATPRSVMFI